MENNSTNLTEQELLTDLLNQEKGLLNLYNTAIVESSCQNMRKSLTDNWSQISNDQYEIFDQMQQLGYYPTKDAAQEDVRQAQNKFQNAGEQLG